MSKLYYCLDCKRIMKNEKSCQYCSKEDLKELSLGAPVNVIGTKIKGKVLKIDDNKVNLLIRDEFNKKYLKDYEIDKIKKVL